MSLGITVWAVDLDDAVDQAGTWIDQVAEAQGWDELWTEYAHARVDYATPGSWDTWSSFWSGDTTQEFWVDLAYAWNLISESADGAPDGWDDMGTAFADAAGTAETAIESQEAGELGTMIIGAAEGSMEQVQEMADPSRSWVPWAVGAVGLGALWVWGNATSR